MPRKHEPMKRTQHYITVQQDANLSHLSTVTGFGVSEHLRRALDVYFGQPEVDKELRRPAPLDPNAPVQLELDLGPYAA